MTMAVFAAFVLLMGSMALGEVPQSQDWLVHPFTQETTVVESSVPNATLLTLSNGLVERAFFVQDGAFCTVEYKHMISRQTFFRGISPEANATLDGMPFDIGGCLGQDSTHYEFWNPDVYFSNLTSNPKAFQFKNYTTSKPEALYSFTPGRRFSPDSIIWPPPGLHLAVAFTAPSSAPSYFKDIIVILVHFEMYDGVAALRKWVSIHHEGSVESSPSVEVETLVMEILRSPNYAPERITVIDEDFQPLPSDQQTLPVAQQVARSHPIWFLDPLYDQCCDRELHVPFTSYTVLIVGYPFNIVYGNTTGPGVVVSPGTSWASMSSRCVLHDSDDEERKGLGIKKYIGIVAPALYENPLLLMSTDISGYPAPSTPFRNLVDQSAAAGFEFIVISFGANGFCGLCSYELYNDTWKAWFREEISYAHEKNISVSAYTLMQHNSWGEETPPSEQVLGVDGQRHGVACFATDFHANYRADVIAFILDVGLDGVETDGQYEGAACADNTGDHRHNGLMGSFSAQTDATQQFNVAIKAIGGYQTSADGYVFTGTNKWNHLDTDHFWSLPFWEFTTVSRMYIWDSTRTRVPTAGAILVQDLATTSTACGTGASRMLCFDWGLASMFGYFTMAEPRTSQLWNPADAQAKEMEANFVKWTTFYKRHRSLFVAGVLVHLLRPDSRSLDGIAIMTPNTTATERAMVSFFNPTLAPLAANVSVSLYYGGFPPGSTVSVSKLDSATLLTTSAAEKHVVGQDGGGAYDIVLDVSLTEKSYQSILSSNSVYFTGACQVLEPAVYESDWIPAGAAYEMKQKNRHRSTMADRPAQVDAAYEKMERNRQETVYESDWIPTRAMGAAYERRTTDVHACDWIATGAPTYEAMDAT
eukprot:CAMPEP_0114548274 /NCGR_PEP_ID=MMETSP0114-20121206/4894_1 /TAXON_ID=31324 /ORGANISM="Goniomonas sp, Strain m" /LENGTH=871 /DNA_ID=CAMNT_0001732853 /DNA_START=1 /DNA_END=2617 /DNA_ORIENTATION=+